VVVNLVVALLSLDLILARVFRVLERGGVSVGGWEQWIGWVDAAYQWLRSIVPSPLLDVWKVSQQPAWVILALAQIWVGWRVLRLVLAEPDALPSPIDATVRNRPALARFMIRWGAITVLMIAALPTLFVTGLVVLHVTVRSLG
jgi:hypothetical protein